jgi:hypothetical protein
VHDDCAAFFEGKLSTSKAEAKLVTPINATVKAVFLRKEIM